VLGTYDVALTNRGREPIEVSLALTAGGVAATLQPSHVRVAAGEHRQLRVLAAVRIAGGEPLAADLVATTPDGARMSRRLTIVPPEAGTTR
jgi:hypothetical protein